MEWTSVGSETSRVKRDKTWLCSPTLWPIPKRGNAPAWIESVEKSTLLISSLKSIFWKSGNDEERVIESFCRVSDSLNWISRSTAIKPGSSILLWSERTISTSMRDPASKSPTSSIEMDWDWPWISTTDNSGLRSTFDSTEPSSVAAWVIRSQSKSSIEFPAWSVTPRIENSRSSPCIWSGSWNKEERSNRPAMRWVWLISSESIVKANGWSDRRNEGASLIFSTAKSKRSVATCPSGSMKDNWAAELPTSAFFGWAINSPAVNESVAENWSHDGSCPDWITSNCWARSRSAKSPSREKLQDDWSCFRDTDCFHTPELNNSASDDSIKSGEAGWTGAKVVEPGRTDWLRVSSADRLSSNSGSSESMWFKWTRLSWLEALITSMT